MNKWKMSSIVLVICLCTVVVQAGTIYQDDFSGAAGSIATTVPEVKPAGFIAYDGNLGLNGNGQIVTTATTPAAYYRFTLGTSPLTDDPMIATIGYKAVLRVPNASNGEAVWIGFQGGNATGFLSTSANSGPYVQLYNNHVTVQGGSIFDGASQTISSVYAAGDVIAAELTYVVTNQTVNLAINGVTILSDFALAHQYPSGTLSDPVVRYAQIQLRNQESDTGAYIDSFQVETTAIPEPETLGLMSIAFAGLLMLRRLRM